MRPDEPASPGDQDPHLEPPAVDVILPVLDERAALPGGAGIDPGRVPGRRGGQRLDRRLGRGGRQPRRCWW